MRAFFQCLNYSTTPPDLYFPPSATSQCGVLPPNGRLERVPGPVATARSSGRFVGMCRDGRLATKSQ